MKTRSILPAVAALIAIASGCNKTEGKKEEPKIPIRISTSVTKVSDNDFESGDAIGLYVVNAVASGENAWSSGNLQASGNHLDNARFSYDGSNWKSDRSTTGKTASPRPTSTATTLTAPRFLPSTRSSSRFRPTRRRSPISRKAKSSGVAQAIKSRAITRSASPLPTG